MHGLWWAVSGHVGARVMLACTDGVSPSRLPVVVAASGPWAALWTRAHWQSLTVDWVCSMGG